MARYHYLQGLALMGAGGAPAAAVSLQEAARLEPAGYRQRRLLYHNLGDGTFEEEAAQFGPVLTEERVSLVQSGTSYLSQDDMRQHFGLGQEKQADLVEVRWPDGTTTKLENVKANQIVRVEQPR